MALLNKLVMRKMYVDFVPTEQTSEKLLYYILINEPSRNVYYFFKLKGEQYALDELDDTVLLDFIFFGNKTSKHINCLVATPLTNVSIENEDNIFIENIKSTQHIK